MAGSRLALLCLPLALAWLTALKIAKLANFLPLPYEPSSTTLVDPHLFPQMPVCWC